MVNVELDSLDPVPQVLKLSNGAYVRVLDLKTRQFFKLLRIVTRGAGAYLISSGLGLTDNPDEFVGKMLGLLVVAVPEAEQETIEFLASIVEPEGLISRPNMSKEDHERNDTLWNAVGDVLVNPEIEDTFDILENVIKREAKDILALGKRLQRMFNLAEKTGNLETPGQTASENASTSLTLTDSSADSALPLI